MSGSTETTFDSIPPGTSVQHSYKVTPLKAKLHYHPTTIVRYTPSEGEAEQVRQQQVSFCFVT